MIKDKRRKWEFGLAYVGPPKIVDLLRYLYSTGKSRVPYGMMMMMSDGVHLVCISLGGLGFLITKFGPRPDPFTLKTLYRKNGKKQVFNK